MNSSFVFFVGLRYISARRKNQLVSFLSGISIAGLVVGVALLVAVLSVVNGFERELQEKILGLIPQATIKHYEGISDWPDLKTELEQDPDILIAAPFIKQNALLSQRKIAEPVIFLGVDPQTELRISNIADYIDKDVFLQLGKKEPAVILGKDLAEKLGAQPGTKVMVIVPDASGTAASPRIAYFTVLALLKTSTEIDNSLVLSSLEQADTLADVPGTVSGMRLKLRDIFNAPQIVYRNLVKLGPGFSGDNWMRTHGNISHSINTSKRLVGLLMSMIVAIALFNVVSSLVMVVMDKQGDIAILRTLGASTRKIMSIFIVQGCAIGFIGTCVGIVLGCILALSIQDIVAAIEHALGTQFLKSDVYPVTYLPAEIRLSDLLAVGLTAFSMSFVATLYPAWRASRVLPAEALRYE